MTRMTPEREAECRKWAEHSQMVAELLAELDATRANIDCYKAVLDGMEFREIPKLTEHSLEFCRQLGVIAAHEIQQRIRYLELTST